VSDVAGSLVFIDTNIFLDFYRQSLDSVGILDKASQNPGLIITGSQVEMEFKKNRQKVILDLRTKVRPPRFDETLRDLPAFLDASKESSALTRIEEKARA
jgi:hypothetical protein